MDVRQFNLEKEPSEKQEYTPSVPTEKESAQPKPAQADTEAVESGDAVPQDPLEIHKKAVADAGVADTVLIDILDSIIVNDYADLSTELLGRIPVVFRTRPAWSQTYLMDRVNTEQITNLALFRDFVGKVNLAASIVRYRDERKLATDVEILERNLAWIETLSQPILSAALTKLALFDSMVIVATSDEGVENFMQPPSDA